MPKRITINLSDADVMVLGHDLIDIDDWVQQAVAGKIASCAKRLAVEARQVLESDPAVESMPAKRAALVAAYIARPDYKNRKQREAEAKAEEAAERAKAKP